MIPINSFLAHILLDPAKLLLFIAMMTIISCKENVQPAVEESQPNVPENLVESFKQGEYMYKKIYYPNGQVKMEGNEKDGGREGKWVSWYEDGTPWSETWFQSGLRHGKTTVWLENGAKYYEGEYALDQPSGKWIFYNEAGMVIQEVQY
jgi:antitoxin component YwqK of YwqJK toxin-antitoxin module